MIRWLAASKSRFSVLAIPILIGFALIILASLGVMYFQQQGEKRSLDDQITQLQRMVLSSPQIGEELQAKCEEIRQAIPVGLEPETVILDILKIAQANGFDISVESNDVQVITVGKARNETIVDTTYEVLVFDITVNSEYDKVEDFVLAMDSAAILKTLVIEALDINKTAEDKATAKIGLAVYTLKG